MIKLSYISNCMLRKFYDNETYNCMVQELKRVKSPFLLRLPKKLKELCKRKKIEIHSFQLPFVLYNLNEVVTIKFKYKKICVYNGKKFVYIYLKPSKVGKKLSDLIKTKFKTIGSDEKKIKNKNLRQRSTKKKPQLKLKKKDTRIIKKPKNRKTLKKTMKIKKISKSNKLKK